MEAASRAGAEMSLAALRRHDPYITSIADLTGQVALYTFSPEANQWEKTDIEGTLFVYRRSASPFHGFTIVNRLNMTNLVEPVNKDLEFQLHEPFLLYRNASREYQCSRVPMIFGVMTFSFRGPDIGDVSGGDL
uniref:5'-(N(7)-methylguanosine 5'-triphospho)-[mRNA] hydrolase n=1 Tax=Vombatus ursinus TaxID=29139 RepID=A0A4X2KW53_VOMUR